MALLSQMFRTAAITGRTDTLNAWFADRQSGRWAEQKVAAAFPTLPHGEGAPHRNPDEMRRELSDLHKRGVLNDAEYDQLRRRPRV